KTLSSKDLTGLVTILDAAQAAGVAGAINPDRVGLFVGAGSNQLGDLTPYFLLVKNCVNHSQSDFDSSAFGAQLLDTVNPMVVMQSLLNTSLCFGARSVDARGANGNYMDFEVSGLRAIGEGYRCLVEGRADCVIAGGVAPTLEPF